MRSFFLRIPNISHAVSSSSSSMSELVSPPSFSYENLPEVYAKETGMGIRVTKTYDLE